MKKPPAHIAYRMYAADRPKTMIPVLGPLTPSPTISSLDARSLEARSTFENYLKVIPNRPRSVKPPSHASGT